jgi:hypothetical protein
MKNCTECFGPSSLVYLSLAISTYYMRRVGCRRRQRRRRCSKVHGRRLFEYFTWWWWWSAAIPRWCARGTRAKPFVATIAAPEPRRALRAVKSTHKTDGREWVSGGQFSDANYQISARVWIIARPLFADQHAGAGKFARFRIIIWYFTFSIMTCTLESRYKRESVGCVRCCVMGRCQKFCPCTQSRSARSHKCQYKILNLVYNKIFHTFLLICKRLRDFFSVFEDEIFTHWLGIATYEWRKTIKWLLRQQRCKIV